MRVVHTMICVRKDILAKESLPRDIGSILVEVNLLIRNGYFQDALIPKVNRINIS